MNKKVKILKYFMVILACIAIFGTVLPNALDPNESLAGKFQLQLSVQLELVYYSLLCILL